MREELDAFTQVNCDRQVVLAPVSDFPGDRLFGLGGEVTTWELAFWLTPWHLSSSILVATAVPFASYFRVPACTFPATASDRC